MIYKILKELKIDKEDIHYILKNNPSASVVKELNDLLLVILETEDRLKELL